MRRTRFPYLLFTTLISICLISACSADTRIERSLAPGATYIEIHRNPAGRTPLSICILKLDRHAGNLSFRAMKGQDHVIGTASVRTMGENLRIKKGEVLATINGDFFIMDKPLAGLPCGMIVRDGELLCSPSGWPAFGIDKDGSPRIALVKLQGDIQLRGQSFPVSAVNRPREVENELALFTPGFGPSTLNTKPGTDVVIQDIVPKLPLKPGVRYSGRVRELRTGVTDDAIPSNAVLLSGDGLAASFLKNNTAVGSTITFSLGFDSEWNQVTQALGGWPILIRNGQLQTIAPDEITRPRYPRSAVGWNENDMYFVAVDGRDTLDDAGMNISELGDFMHELGCTEAMNLDGGGSTILTIRGNVVNDPSDGLDRSVSSGWAVINSAPTGTLKSLHVWPENLSILAGSHVQLRVLGADADGNPVPVDPRRVKWSLDGIEASSSASDPDSENNTAIRVRTNNELGSVDASGIFTAAHVFRAGRITARIGEVSAAGIVNIWDKPAALFVIPTDQVLKPRQSVRCSVLATDRSGRPMLLDESLVTWKAEGVTITSAGILSVPDSGRFKVIAEVAGVRAGAEYKVSGD